MTNINMTPIVKAVDELKKEAVFICYEPNTVDAHDEWMSPQTIELACRSFNDFLTKGVVVPNLFHMKNELGVAESTDSFVIKQSWVTPVDCIIGTTEVKEGTWLVKVKFENETLWQLFLQGEVSGVSIGARGLVGI